MGEHPCSESCVVFPEDILHGCAPGLVEYSAREGNLSESPPNHPFRTQLRYAHNAGISSARNIFRATPPLRESPWERCATMGRYYIVDHIIPSCSAHLYMAYNQQVTDVGLWCIARHTLVLRELNVSGCHGITNIGLRSLAICCRNMELLDFAGCTRLTDLGLRVIGGGCW